MYILCILNNFDFQLKDKSKNEIRKNNTQSNQKNRGNLGKIDNPDAHIQDRSLPWLGTIIGK